MKLILLLLGVIIHIVVLVDIFKTIVYINGAGFLSKNVSRFLWNLFYKLARGDGEKKVLSYCGPIILLFFLFMWTSLIWLGYSLIFISEPGSVINNSTNLPASILEKIYYVGYNLTSLGNGEYSAATNSWKLFSNVMGLNSMIFISLGVSYLLPVLQAVIDKRTLAVHISKLGTTPLEIIENGYDGESFGPLYDRFNTLENLLIKHGERHLAYPILHYFHTTERVHAMPLSLAVLDEAISIQMCYNIDQSPKKFHWEVLKGAIDNFYYRLDDQYLRAAKNAPKFNYKEQLPTYLQEVISANECDNEKLDERRSRILGYIHNDGWKWSDVIESKNDS